jgi:class 3 adenylate cyclase
MSERLPRKLAAILYADVAGYSRLTGEDEDATHHILRAHLNFISSAIQNHSGRVVHYAGDAVLADFSTVLDALTCATAIQEELEKRNADFPEDRKVQFRIGVNLGDVIVDQDDIYGDGVNVAARLESLAEPGGICISDAVRTSVGNKLPLEFDDMGNQQVKNIERLVRAYRSRPKLGGDLSASKSRPMTFPHSKSGRRKWKNITVVAVIAMIGIIAIFIRSTKWEWGQQLSSDILTESQILGDNLRIADKEDEQSLNGTKALQTSSETLIDGKRDSNAPSGNFLSEDEIRRLIIGNTINFRAPRNGEKLNVYFAEDGGVTVKAENNPNLVMIHTWFFKDGDLFCRTVLADKRNHCTRVLDSADANTLNFFNAKKGFFYTATVLEGKQLLE